MKGLFLRTAFFIFICAAMCGNALSQSRQRIYTVKSTVATVKPKQNNSRKNFDDGERQVYALINAERRRKKLGDLSWDNNLAKVARDYSKKMARGNFFSHYDREGGSVASRIKSSNITGWRKVGENLFYCEGIDDFDSFAVKGWMKSSGHRENILDKSWTATGIGIAESGGRIYVTQVFIQR